MFSLETYFFHRDSFDELPDVRAASCTGEISSSQKGTAARLRQAQESKNSSIWTNGPPKKLCKMLISLRWTLPWSRHGKYRTPFFWSPYLLNSFCCFSWNLQADAPGDDEPVPGSGPQLWPPLEWEKRAGHSEGSQVDGGRRSRRVPCDQKMMNSSNKNSKTKKHKQKTVKCCTILSSGVTPHMFGNTFCQARTPSTMRSGTARTLDLGLIFEMGWTGDSEPAIDLRNFGISVFELFFWSFQCQLGKISESVGKGSSYPAG